MIQTDATIKAALLVDKVDDLSSGTGYLHCIIDDWNLEDKDIIGARAMISQNPHNIRPENLAVETEFLDAFELLTIPERASALAIFENFYSGQEAA
ncbi:MAG: hypothetical protein M0Z43_09810 [Acidithiobacillus sp.]|nr:hypothetical protein [Acidithiobacillus sp.]